MSFFEYKNGTLHAENIPLSKIADAVGTPCYVYSRAAFEAQWRSLDSAFGSCPHTICYAVKSNSNIAILNILAKLGSGFDVVSEGELRRVLLAGGDPTKVVFSGVAKSWSELEFAVNQTVQSINVESVAELERVQEVAQSLGKVAPIAIRVNPDVDPKTHPYISTGMDEAKFGVPMEAAFDAYIKASSMPNIEVHGIACHIGSQITKTSPFSDSLDIVLQMVKRLAEKGVKIKQLDLGGGLGIDYQGETPPTAQEYVDAMLNGTRAHGIDLPIAIEPGRYISGNSGVLLSKVEYLKRNHRKAFAIVDAGMNDLLRPSLYQAHHAIWPVSKNTTIKSEVFDVVGPVCESADVLGHDRELTIQGGDLISIMSAGAYGFVMSANYNSRLRPAEVVVDGAHLHVVRQREQFEDLVKGERIIERE